MSQGPEQDLRKGIVAGYRRLVAAGLNVGSTGNVSCRIEGGLLITPSGASADSLTEEGIVSLTLDGQVRGPGVPSSEWDMHAEIYRRYDAAQAVVHTHGDACTALSCMRRDIPAFHYMIASFGGDDVRCARYAPFGSRQLAEAAADALDGRSACLLANHGMICHARNLDQAVAAALKLETLARQYLMTLQAGGPVLLDDAQMSEVRARYRYYGTRRMPGGAVAEEAPDPIVPSTTRA